MNNALAVRENSLPIQSMSEMAGAGDLLAQANFLGCKSKGEGFLVMAVCQQTGMSLLDFQQKYHVRQGRISMQAHAMLAEFESRGGKFVLIERSVNRAAILLKKGESEYLSELTWEQALQEPFVYAGKESDQLAELAKPVAQRALKAKYATPRSRMQMLWARVISDGVGTIDPGARQAYTPEETEDFVDVPHRQAEQVVSLAAAQEMIVETVQQPEPATPAPSTGVAAKLASMAAAKAAPAAAEINYAVCPVAPKGAEQLKGMAWADMKLAHLKSALKAAVDGRLPDITPAHQIEIEAAIAAKQQDGLKYE